MVLVSAPGKIHLIGEHAVVYGEPAIIASVGLRTFVDAKKSENVKIFSQSGTEEYNVADILTFTERALQLWKQGNEKGNFSELFSLINKKGNYRKAAIGITLKRLEIKGGVSLKLYGEIPIGSGLGSSASLAVAITKAIAECYGLDVPLETINNIAFETESLVHGTPSGGDNTACCYGGLVWFQKGNPNIIIPLKKEIPYKLENFVLVYTKKPEKTTGELVSQVRGLNPEFRNKRIKNIGNATHKMLDALKNRDLENIKKLINLAWDNLSELGLSIPEADILINKIREIGGAAKLCGACGGGIMLCYHENQKKLFDVIENLGYEPMRVELAVDGVRLENNL